ncbi:ABC transporter ATP-binding protein [Paraburkholderia rhynchosiae]|uniref:ABC transporter ATP-binding protein n=1 Tax=Paraburkholderia rhynchosiae TaxID=487049 RepID=A0A2N7WYM5_9BURK|nr:ABC transporter ATP-binding protein [Paraburkholderia rhynchosiae]PMS34422.1 ABC transporter ATP-binding protein [Paraburkholderia rhynchosiae]CAB3637079.1 Ferric enterobactin transport ATP-binding protein FepC [Paraburkholderia rhynchosiae]
MMHTPKFAQPVLSAQRMTLRAGSRTLLDAFTHTFYPGEVWCVAGPNGAGKTTLLSTLAGLLQPSAGHVELDGVRLADWHAQELAQRRALMPQSAPDAFSASVLDIVMLNRFPHLTGWGWEREADREAARAALELLGLTALAARDVLSLSGGERQRVALAAVLCQEAPLLLLDEPLSHLDLHHQIDCLEALSEWAQEPRRSVLFSCHDLNLARRFSTHALLLDGAGAAYAGPVHEVLTPALTSRVFGYPLILIRDGEHEALIPAPRSRHESGSAHDKPAS